jgi:hypothetical protein
MLRVNLRVIHEVAGRDVRQNVATTPPRLAR